MRKVMKSVTPGALVIFIFCGFLCSHCGTKDSSRPVPGEPDWLNEYVEQAFLDQSPPVSHRATVTKGNYKGQVVYETESAYDVSEVIAIVFLQSGERLCSPIGGVTGNGDGKCADFYSIVTDRQVIWKDPR